MGNNASTVFFRFTSSWALSVLMAGALLFSACDAKVPGPPATQVVKSVAAARRVQILYGAKNIIPGMSAVEVQNALGKPDETADIMEQEQKTGYTLTYILEHPADAHSPGKLLRIHFDLNDQVTLVEDLTQ